jgi:hypothetical protein
MAETEKQNCKFFLLRYVPDVVKNEFVNIGVVLLPPAAPVQVRFARDWSRLRAMDPAADLEVLDAFAGELQARLAAEGGESLLLKKMNDWFSNSVQITESQGCVTASPAQEADELARIYLESTRPRSSKERSGRQVLLTQMRKAFEFQGIWKAMAHDIPASKYTTGDPLEIDCGYRAGQVIRMFHATPLRKDVSMAKTLAFTFPRMAQGIRQAEGVGAELSAIVEDGLPEGDETIRFAREILEQQSIAIVSMSQMPDVAAQAAREMR